VTVTAPDGAHLSALAHGGQLMGWTPAGGSRDHLWTSPLATCGPGLAVRGGVPVIFPQFSGRGPLPRHGFVRDRAWRVDASSGVDGARIEARIEDDDGTRAIWPHAFTLVTTAVALGRGLRLGVEVRNAGSTPFSFAVALHTYLRVRHAGRAEVHGLGGLTAEENAAPGTPVPLPDGPLRVAGPLDVAVRGLSGPVTLHDPDEGDVRLRLEGFDDLVVWNPGVGAEPSDVPEGHAAHFVCLEPARLDPVHLAPGEVWAAGATYEAQEPAGGQEQYLQDRRP
jgi:glucose-6-phosphate 1-epimerase